MILFNYALSPYAEKIRTMLGYTDTAWQSVTVSPMPPRKGLDALTGGYRRIPVAQIGADIFCDTRIISAEVAAASGKPELAFETSDPQAASFAQTVEREKFMAAVRSVPPKAMLKQVLSNHLPHTIFKLLRDRSAMAKNAAVKMPGGSSSAALYTELLQDIEAQLQSEFLFGASPCIADFSAYHLVWFNHELGGQHLPEQLTKLHAWFERMHAFGHGRRESQSMRYALQQASDNEPRAIAGDCAVVAEPREVSIGPNDYGLDQVSGKLVGEGDSRWIIAREAEGCGTVHVHFPKEGYTVA